MKRSPIITTKQVVSISKQMEFLPVTFSFIGTTKAEHDSFFGEKKCSAGTPIEIIIQIANAFQLTTSNFGNLKFIITMYLYRIA